MEPTSSFAVFSRGPTPRKKDGFVFVFFCGFPRLRFSRVRIAAKKKVTPVSTRAKLISLCDACNGCAISGWGLVDVGTHPHVKLRSYADSVSRAGEKGPSNGGKADKTKSPPHHITIINCLYRTGTSNYSIIRNRIALTRV